ncbi:GNAT family N-acetyltransferase [Haloglomus litoreum]|uniref:GNAT family N-acetyltransferase n=1 Tax=Haloglomus litoreum TaxID=3034026 RepID=UPI0023E8724C|nr:GNAT family N-acetyltransferase [Haloglomus sp. DT116]
MNLETISLSDWDDALPERGYEPFHTAAALEVVADHATGDLELLCGYKGDRPVALLPLVRRDERVGEAVLSPPPSLGIPRLGPLLMPASPKQRKRESLNRAFTEAVLDHVGADGRFTLFRTICPPGYGDPRPYEWAGLTVEPTFTYRLDVAGRSLDDIRSGFSRSLRREIRDAEDLDLTLSREGIDGAREVFEATAERYADQGRSFPMAWEYVRDLLTAMDEHARVYVLRDGDRFLTGITVLYSADRAYFWQGGARTVHEGVSVNSLVHWDVLRELVEDPPAGEPTAYDLMGANTERLCRYKSKFGATLEPYYVVESAGRSMEAAKRAHGLLSR